MNETQKKVKELFKKLLRAEKQDFPEPRKPLNAAR